MDFFWEVFKRSGSIEAYLGSKEKERMKEGKKQLQRPEKTGILQNDEK